MDNPKKANQGKYNRSKTKKEHFSKGSKSNKSTDGDKHQKISNEKKKSEPSNSKWPHVSAARQQPSSAADKTESDSTAQQKIVNANLKKETEEIANLTQKYGRRHLVSTWTRDFDIPCSRDSDNDEEGADFNELINGCSTDFVGRHFMLKEEQEWIKESDSSDSPFSLDLKCLETGISCIPFYRRHNLSEKSFNPKEVQVMISEAQSNEMIYEEIKRKERDRVILNKQTENRNVLIDKDPAYDTILSIMKQEDNSLLTSNTSKQNASDFVSTALNKVERLEDPDNVRTKTSLSERGGNKFLNNFTSSTNNSLVSASVNDTGKNDDALEPKGQRQSRFKQSNITTMYSPNCTTENSKVLSDSSVEDGKQIVNDSGYKDLSNPDFVIQSLEPRSQRQPRREIKRNEVSVDNGKEKIFEIDQPSISSFIGLNSCRKIKNEEVCVDEETDRQDLSFCEQSSITSKQVESNDFHNEFSFVLPKTENTFNDDEKVELNLSSLKKLKDCIKPNEIEDKELENKSSSRVKNNNDVPLSLFSQDSVKIESNITEKNDDVSSFSNQRKGDEKSVKTNEKLFTNYDDDLDFLLGLDKPAADNGSSNLSILQEKLKGKIKIPDRKDECNNLNTSEKSNMNRNVHKNSYNEPDEDLDEWLDSVLEK